MIFLLRTIDRFLYAIVAFALSFLITVTFVDVVSRGFFNLPVPGAYELIESSMVLLVFTSLPIASSAGVHIKVDFMEAWMAPRITWALDRFSEIAAFCVFCGITYIMCLRALRVREDGDHSAVLHIDRWPFAYYMFLMLAVTALIHLIRALQDFRQRNQKSPAKSSGEA